MMGGPWILPEADNYFRPLLERDPRGFQIDHLDVALRHCKQFRTAVDGGAHIGTWTRALAQRFQSVLAFEPAADTYRCLLANMAGLSNVVSMEVALGDAVGRATVHDDPTRVGNTGARFVSLAADGAVAVVPLDLFALSDVDLLKLDVEGHELEALQGAEQTLARCRPVVVIEVKPLRPGHDPMRAVVWLEARGYREVGRAGRDRVYVEQD